MEQLMKDLLEAGAHFGHQTHRWNPKMAPFIYGQKNKVHIIDLTKTVEKLEEAEKFVSGVVSGGGKVLFVGTKKQGQAIIKEEAEKCGMPYVNERWLGGMITNFTTVLSRTRYLKELEAKLAEELTDIEAELSSPDVSSDTKKLKTLSKRHSELKEIVELFESINRLKNDLAQSKELETTETDPDMKEFISEQISASEAQAKDLEKKLTLLLIPSDPSDAKNVILEIRAGTGGEEAALFGGNLFRMYARYAEKKGWKVSILSQNTTGIEGVKEMIAKIEGEDVYKHLKYESGVHRVQRVPETESSGRIHTSAATVAVMPEAEEVDIEIEQKDIRIDVFRSSGPGGQSVNTTDSAVRITHLPSGMVVSCQDEKSQLKNRDKAMSILRARLLALKQEEEAKKRSDMRKSQIGSGDRSEKIRTYNFPQDRVTDHRINLTVHNLPDVLAGNLDPVVEALLSAEHESAIQSLESPST